MKFLCIYLYILKPVHHNVEKHEYFASTEAGSTQTVSMWQAVDLAVKIKAYSCTSLPNREEKAVSKLTARQLYLGFVTCSVRIALTLIFGF